MHHRMIDILSRFLTWIIACSLAALALTLFWMSRYQPIEWDLAMMHYIAYLVNEKGFVLYRDIFENNLPGAFLFQCLLGKLFGYEAIALRGVDFFILLGIALFSWRLLSPLSRPAAIFAPSLFAVVYFSAGSYVFLQRDYLGILPILVAAAYAISKKNTQLRDFILLGALSGFACGFKPNVIVAFPALFLIAAFQYRISIQREKSIFLFYAPAFISMSSAFCAIFVIPFIWGIWHCDYKQFLYIYQTFTPIYVNSRIDLFQYANLREHLASLVESQLHELKFSAMTCLPGLGWAWLLNKHNPENRTRVISLAILAFAYSWYELMAGKYWFAHLLPTYYWDALCFSLLLTTPTAASGNAKKIIGICAALIAAGYAIHLSKFVYEIRSAVHYTSSNSDIRSQKIGAYLKQHLQPGDTVQGIDGSGDGQGSLLIARAAPATRYLEDIPLYMQPEAAATQAFRREFLDTLAQKPPAYIVYIHNFWHPAGGNRLKEFKELHRFIGEHYDEAVLEDGQFTIYKRKEKTL